LHGAILPQLKAVRIEYSILICRRHILLAGLFIALASVCSGLLCGLIFLIKQQN